MRPIKVLTDSCGDLNQGLLEKYNIDYLKMRTVLDGKESPALLTMSDEEFHTLYNVMRDKRRVTTTQVPTAEFLSVFTKYLEEGYDILYIGCSSKQSGSVNAGSVVAKQLFASYPDAKIYCVDSLNASIGEGMLAIEAAKLVSAGKDIDTVLHTVLDMRNRVNEYVTVHSLDALYKAGRVKGSAAFFGNLMGVKPIIISDANGTQAAFKKVRGRMTSLKELAALLKESIIEPEKQTVYIAHADCGENEINALKGFLAEAIPTAAAIESVYIGPIVGSSIGPDAIGVFAFGKEITFTID